jgi:peptide/nickel transport system ATP-binding protein
MCAHALMGLLPDTVTVDGGEILFEGHDLLKLDSESWHDLRGRRLAMVFQEPMTALNPLMRIGDQLMEVFEAHDLLTPKTRKAKALALVREVGLPDPERIIRAYPHQLSGGQRQRAMIAMALALEPAVLVADEPTTALDVTTQAQILKLIRNLQKSHNMAVMFITHDFGVVADIADQVVVLRHGKVVEEGPASAVFADPQHDYTKALLAAVLVRSAAARLARSRAQGGRGDRPRQDVCDADRLVQAEPRDAGGQRSQFHHPQGRDARSRRRVRLRQIVRGAAGDAAD